METLAQAYRTGKSWARGAEELEGGWCGGVPAPRVRVAGRGARGGVALRCPKRGKRPLGSEAPGTRARDCVVLCLRCRAEGGLAQGRLGSSAEAERAVACRLLASGRSPRRLSGPRIARSLPSASTLLLRQRPPFPFSCFKEPSHSRLRRFFPLPFRSLSFFLSLFFFSRVLLCRLGQLLPHFVARAGLEVAAIPNADITGVQNHT